MNGTNSDVGDFGGSFSQSGGVSGETCSVGPSNNGYGESSNNSGPEACGN